MLAWSKKPYSVRAIFVVVAHTIKTGQDLNCRHKSNDQVGK